MTLKSLFLAFILHFQSSWVSHPPIQSHCLSPLPPNQFQGLPYLPNSTLAVCHPVGKPFICPCVLLCLILHIYQPQSSIAMPSPSILCNHLDLSTTLVSCGLSLTPHLDHSSSLLTASLLLSHPHLPPSYPDHCSQKAGIITGFLLLETGAQKCFLMKIWPSLPPSLLHGVYALSSSPLLSSLTLSICSACNVLPTPKSYSCPLPSR